MRPCPIHALLLFIASAASAYKILVYSPKFAYAHTRFMGVLADVLVDAGHDVTLLLNEVDLKVRTNGSSKARIVYIAPHPTTVFNMKKQQDEEFCRAIWSIGVRNPMLILALKYALSDILVPQCQHLLNQDEIIAQLRDESFDVGITETMDSCGVGIFHVLGITSTITGSSLALLERTASAIGVDAAASYLPGSLAPVTDDMSFINRVENLVSVLLTDSMLQYVEQQEEDLFRKKYGEDFPALYDLIGRSTYTFTNMMPYLDFPRPSFPRLMDLGGITMSDNKNTNQSYISELSTHRQIILMSFGSIATSSQMPEEYKRTLIQVIKQFPDMTFIWKHEDPQDERLLVEDNIVTSPWVDQKAILAHPNTVAFVTHGGLNSVTEAVLMGKPMLVVPMFADQTRTALLLEKRGLGLTIHKEHLANYDTVHQAFYRLIHDHSLKDTCKRFVRLQNKTDSNPKKLFVKNVELLAEFGPLPEIDQMSRHLNFFVLHSLDVFLFFFSLSLFLLYVSVLLIKSFLNFIGRFAPKKKVQ